MPEEKQDGTAVAENPRILYEVDGKVVADIRSANDLVGRIELFPGWVVVEKVKLSEASRGGIILPNADAKDEQHMMLFKIATAGPPKLVNGSAPDMRTSQGDIVILKPVIAQFLVKQNHQFGVIAAVDIIGRVKVDGEQAVQQTDPVAVAPEEPDRE